MNNENMTLGQWLLTFLIGVIPCVGIIMYCVWAFGSNVNPSKKTYAQATLIFMVIGVVLAVLAGFSGAFASLAYYG